LVVLDSEGSHGWRAIIRLGRPLYCLREP
jgi:hypothetical protein